MIKLNNKNNDFRPVWSFFVSVKIHKNLTMKNKSVDRKKFKTMQCETFTLFLIVCVVLNIDNTNVMSLHVNKFSFIQRYGFDKLALADCVNRCKYLTVIQQLYWILRRLIGLSVDSYTNRHEGCSFFGR